MKYRFLMVIKLYSGILDSMHQKSWDPKGVPAIYKLIEALDQHQDIELDVVFACRRAEDSRDIKKPTLVCLPNFESTFYMLPQRKFWHIRLFRGLNHFLQLIFVLRLILRKKYNLIYGDRTFIDLLNFSASILKKNVVLRLLGTNRNIKRLGKNLSADTWPTKIRKRLARVNFHGPFRYVICTLDGSSGKRFIKSMMRPSIPHDVLLNGVDLPRQSVGIIEIKHQLGIFDPYPVVLFVSRLEEGKGCLEFVEALIQLHQNCDEFYGLVLGEGSLKAKMQERIQGARLNKHVFFMGNVAHQQIGKYYSIANIYVSLNQEGSLNNTVLEALAYGKCILRLAGDLEELVDQDTDQILPEEAVPRINRNEPVDDLARLLFDLIEHPEKIERYAQQVQALSKQLLWSWEDRIDFEVNQLLRIAQGLPPVSKP